MGIDDHILPFPTRIPELSQSAVMGAAIESSGHVEADRLQVLHLDNLRRIHLLLLTPTQIAAASTMHQLKKTRLLVNDVLFTAGPDSHPYQSIGREHAWMPEVIVEGKFVIDDIRPIPLREILEDHRLPAQATVIVGTLDKNSTLVLPRGINQVPGKEYFVFGQSIRTVDTFPDRPGGGTHAAA